MDNFQGVIKTEYRNSIQHSQENIDPLRLSKLYDAGMKISQWLLKARSSAELTQTQLGDALGVTKGNVSAWENDRHEPSWSQMIKISELTGSPLPLPNTVGKNDATWPFRLSHKEFDQLPPEEIERINSFLDFTYANWKQSHQNKSKKTA